MPMASPPPSPVPVGTGQAQQIVLNQQQQANTASQGNVAATVVQQQALGSVFATGVTTPATQFNWQSAFSSAPSVPSGSLLAGTPGAPPQAAPAAAPAAAQPVVTVHLKNACKDAAIQALLHVRDTLGNWQTTGFFSVAPGKTADVGSTWNRIVYVFGQQQGGRPCNSGGRCWSGSAGPWPFNGQDYSFLQVNIPASVPSYVYTFEC